MGNHAPRQRCPGSLLNVEQLEDRLVPAIGDPTGLAFSSQQISNLVALLSPQSTGGDLVPAAQELLDQEAAKAQVANLNLLNLHTQITDIENQLAPVNAQVAALQESTTALADAKNLQTTLQTDRITKQNALAMISPSVQSLQADVTMQQGIVAPLQQQYDQASAQLKSVTNALTQTQTQLTSARGSLDQGLSRQSDLTRQISDAQNRIQAIDARLAEIGRELAALPGTIRDLQRKIDQDTQTYQRQNIVYQRAVRDYNDAVQKSQQHPLDKSLEKVVVVSQKKMSDEKDKRDQMGQAVANDKAAFAAAKRSQRDLPNEANDALRERTTLTNRLPTLQTQLTNVNRTIPSLQSRVRALATRVDTLGTQKSSRTDRLHALYESLAGPLGILQAKQADLQNLLDQQAALTQAIQAIDTQSIACNTLIMTLMTRMGPTNADLEPALALQANLLAQKNDLLRALGVAQTIAAAQMDEQLSAEHLVTYFGTLTESEGDVYIAALFATPGHSEAEIRIDVSNLAATVMSGLAEELSIQTVPLNVSLGTINNTGRDSTMTLDLPPLGGSMSLTTYQGWQGRGATLETQSDASFAQLRTILAGITTNPVPSIVSALHLPEGNQGWKYNQTYTLPDGARIHVVTDSGVRDYNYTQVAPMNYIWVTNGLLTSQYGNTMNCSIGFNDGPKYVESIDLRLIAGPAHGTLHINLADGGQRDLSIGQGGPIAIGETVESFSFEGEVKGTSFGLNSMKLGTAPSAAASDGNDALPVLSSTGTGIALNLSPAGSLVTYLSAHILTDRPGGQVTA